MAMGVTEIRGWLLCQPRPSSLRVQGVDERTHEVNVKSGVSWMAVAQSVHALMPDLIEAYDDEGKLIRAVRPSADTETEQQTGTPPASLVLPAGTDPQSVLLLHFADLLASAYRHSTDVAFERLASLFEAVNRRSEALERSLDTTHRLLRRAYQDNIDNAEPAKESDLLKEMVEGFVAGQTQNGATPGANGKAG
jgi:hypothetical protein